MRSHMRPVPSQSGIITWLIAMALGRMPVSATSQAKVPLPDDIRIVPPGSEVPREQAAFSGKWFGIWGGVDVKHGSREHILIVERITTEAPAVVAIFAWGPGPRWQEIPGEPMQLSQVGVGCEGNSSAETCSSNGAVMAPL